MNRIMEDQDIIPTEFRPYKKLPEIEVGRNWTKKDQKPTLSSLLNEAKMIHVHYLILKK